jgi:hypothetical protein
MRNGRVAEALEGQPGEPPMERLAHHYSQGQCWAQALEYLVRAGDKAAAAYANHDALDFYAQALAVCEKLGDAALPTVVVVAQKRGDLHMLSLRGQPCCAAWIAVGRGACAWWQRGLHAGPGAPPRYRRHLRPYWRGLDVPAHPEHAGLALR